MATQDDKEKAIAMRFTISDIKYEEGGELKQAFYAKFIIGTDDAERTVMMEKPHEPTTLDALMSDVIKIQIYTSHRLRRDNFKGVTLGESIGNLSDLDGVISRRIYKHNAAGVVLNLHRTIHFKMQIILGPNEPKRIPGLGEQPISFSSRKVVKLELDGTVEEAKAALRGTEPAPWPSLLAKVENFNRLMSGISEVHPYSKLAWGILSGVAKLLVDQVNRDENIRQLVALLDDVFVFLGDASQLDVFSKTQIQLLILLSHQVTECGHFIHDYAKDTSYWKRTIKHTVSEVDSKIEEYKNVFNQLKSNFTDHAILRTQISVLQVKFSTQTTLDKLDDIAMDLVIDKIVYAPGARYNPDKGCLPSTRQTIMDEIVDWANKPSSSSGSQILWLSGVAGSGKSAIAHSVAQRFQTVNRLGSSFCFDVASQAVRGPQHLFATLARDLGNWDQTWKQALWNVLKTNPSLQSSYSITEQFESFLLKPSKFLRVVGPVVIVIDALDEAGDIQSRKSLLSILSKNVAELPNNFRIIITSRPESDIVRALRSCKHVFSKYMDDIQQESTNKDILQYLHSAISEENRASLDKQWPNQAWCQLLVQKAEGLFQWITTVCLFIESEFYTAVGQLQIVLQSSDKTRNFLDALYTTILDQKTSGGDKNKVSQMVSIMKTVLTLKKPLPMFSLCKLCYNKDLSVVKSALQPLGALMSGVSSESIPIQTLHTSLWDYLTDQGRSGIFHVDTSQEHENLVLASLSVMDELHFNICQLPSSYQRNKDIKDMGGRIQQFIPPYLSYACIFWADHLRGMEFQSSLCMKFTQFLNSKLLYWLEVLSIMGVTHIAILSLLELKAWMEKGDIKAAALAGDAHKFVATFLPVIAESVPHIYLSALPFAPEKSVLAKNYLQNFKNTLFLTSGKQKNWPEIQNVIRGHKSAVHSVKFSPDGKMILSSSADRTIRLWDVQSGQPIFPPIFGHTDDINSVAFSPDGKCFASGSDDKTVRIWSTETGNPIGIPFEGHTESVMSVVFSPDGKYIASGSNDKFIKIWDVSSGQAKNTGKFEGHTDKVQTVDFSPNGQFIASGSMDKTVWVWDSETGLPTAPPFKGHTYGVTSVAFSPNNLFLVSSSSDGTIKFWDVLNKDLIASPFKVIDLGNHWTSSISFSPNQKYIALGIDNTISVWDISGGYIVAGPFEGHTDSVMAVSFSPDGEQIVSGSGDASIMIWDANFSHETAPIAGNANQHEEKYPPSFFGDIAISLDSLKIASCLGTNLMVWDMVGGQALWSPQKGQAVSSLNSAKFSPDGQFLVSGSDSGIQLWDAASGNDLCKPFIGHTCPINSVGFSPDGKLIVSGSDDATIRIWDVMTGLSIDEPFQGHESGVSCVLFSPDGKHIISSSADETLRLWSIETGTTIVGPFKGHTENVYTAACSPDGKYIASGSFDLTIRVWNTQTGVAVGKPSEFHMGMVLSIKFSPNGQYIISGSVDKTIKIINTQTGDLLATCEGHSGWVSCLDISSDGKWIVSGSGDKTIRIWDVEELLQPSTDPFPPPDGAPLFGHEFSIVNGWVLGPSEELLFWLPIWNAGIAFSPRNPTIITSKSSNLDYSNYVHGNNWEKCKTDV